MSETGLEKMVREFARDPEYIAMGLATAVIEDALMIMKPTRNVTEQAEAIGKAIGASASAGRRLLDCKPSMTLLDVAKLAVSLKATPTLKLRRERAQHQAQK